MDSHFLSAASAIMDSHFLCPIFEAVMASFQSFSLHIYMALSDTVLFDISHGPDMVAIEDTNGL